MPESRYYVRYSFFHILSKIGFFTKTENLPQYNSKTPNVRFLVEFTSFDAFNIHPLPGKFCSILWFVLGVFIEIFRQSKVTNLCSVTILSMEATFKYKTHFQVKGLIPIVTSQKKNPECSVKTLKYDFF